VTIAAAIPKGDRLDWMVQKLVEVGVMCIVLVDCRRSVVRWRPERRATQLDRLRRVGRDAAMQSRRVWLPTIDGPVPLSDAVAGGGAVLADPDGDPLTTATTVVIGPEGGFTAEELELAPAVSLGEQILRVETAALVAAILTRSL
jgi:16S rRNA (uracil1498-N3)-methyltransferase